MRRRPGPFALIAAAVAAVGAPVLEVATGSPLPYSLILTLWLPPTYTLLLDRGGLSTETTENIVAGQLNFTLIRMLQWQT